MLVAGAGVLFAFLSFGLSGYFQYSTGKAFIDLERLFWGGGHVLQFTNTISMVTAWMLLAGYVFGTTPMGGRAAKALYAVYLLFIVPSPFIYFIHDTATRAHRDSFTALMQWGHGFPTVVFVLAVVALLLKNRPLPLKRPGLSALGLSMILFALGGVVALRIHGVNTIIPAHYHFVIGAVTIAFMGLFYESAPVVGRRVYWPRLAAVQPYLYFFGIVLFAGGLFTAGLFGVMRKTYAGEQNLDQIGKLIGMGVMGLGGLVSILGGVAFVLNALFTLLHKGARGGRGSTGMML
jgi:heme/copper-type cytochrome/quinol oxidase subunit 1